MIELLANSEMSAADRMTIAGGTPGFDLMQRAGLAVAEAVGAGCPAGAVVGVVTGSGNNGGDGFVAARILRDRGYDVRVLVVSDVAKLKGDAAQAHAFWEAGVERATPDRLAGVRIIIDAIFGAGLDRPVEGEARTMIEAMNAARVPVVAVDLPSGISGDTGEVLGAAVEARKTVTFFEGSPGMSCFRAGCIAVRCASPTSASKRKSLHNSPLVPLPMHRHCGVRHSRDRLSPDTSIPVGTPWWSRAAPPTPARPG